MGAGAGYIDAQGIYRYGEDDATGPLFSDFLDLGMASVSAQFAAQPEFVAASATARDAHWGTPADATARLALQARGATTYRTDKGWTERFYARLTDGGVNAGGATASGWYPISGKLPAALLTRNGTAYAAHPNNAYTLMSGTYLDTVLQRDATVAGGVITIVTPGEYEISAGVAFQANGTGARQMAVTKNITGPPLASSRLYLSAPGAAAANTALGGSRKCILEVGDEIRMFTFQNSGAVLPVLNASEAIGGTYLEVSYIGPA